MRNMLNSEIGQLSLNHIQVPRPFLLFDLTYRMQLEFHRMIGWAHPDLVVLASKGGLNLYIDCTFDVVPHPFVQMLVIMLYDEASQMFLPVFHILLQSKHEDVYIEAIHQCIVATGHKLDGISITCDFEKGLLKACKSQFPLSYTVLCEFHFKQSLRRKLLSLKVDQDLITELIGPDGAFEILFVLPPEEISSYGNFFMRHLL